jgi:lysyl endopeptidase
MNKLFITIMILSLSMVGGFAATHEAIMLKSPGEFNAVEFVNEHQVRLDWLKAEAAPLLPENIFSIRVSEKEIEAIETYHCETCGTSIFAPEKRRVGIVKPLGISFSDIVPFRTESGYVWTVVIEGLGASALRVHLTNFNLPEGAALYVYNTDGTAFGPYTGLGPHEDGDFWANTVFGTLAYVQLHYNGSNPEAINCRVEDVGYLGSKFLLAFLQKPPVYNEEISTPETLCSYNEPCVEDASCYTSGTYPAIADHRYAVAHMQWVSGVWLYYCTGGLVNNTSGDFTPYFLTANHCISKSRTAKSLECYFRYWTSTCHGSCYNPVGVCPRTLGATFLKGSSSTSDFTLLRLNQAPPSGSVFLGWTTSAVAYTNGFQIYRLSHPSGAPQAFSKHSVDTSALTCTGWPRGAWIYSRDVIGATEGGSSGSPVCNSSGQIVGQLSGACGYNPNDPCDYINNATVDGAFANYYSLVASWLNPN